jgi:sugar phosphate isomerase/epimerase
MNVKISGFYDEISGKLDKQLEVVKKLGESYICPRVIDGKNIAEFGAEEFERDVKPRLEKSGVGFSSIGSPIGKIDIDDEEGFERQLKQLAELVKIAKSMKCGYIRVFSFFYGKRNPDSVHGAVVEKMKRFLEVAKGSGVKLMHENEKKIYGDVPERVLKLYREIDDENLALCFDASNFVQCGVEPKKAFDSLKDYVSYYHVKDCGAYGVEVPVGMGKGDYEYIVEQLKKRDYQGFMTLEPHTFKYAVLKLPVYLFPFAPLFMKNYFATFRAIDREAKICPLKAVSRERVFVWQYERLKKLLG